VAGWDEDALTMSVEAARLVFEPDSGAKIRRVTFASTSAPFTDRSQAGLLVDALHLDRRAATLDVAGTRRCAVSALSRALQGGSPGGELLVAGEKRRAQPGSAAHLNWGDGAAAVTVGDSPGLARLVGIGTINADLLDSYTSGERGLHYQSEERFVRDQAVEAVLTPGIQQALADAGISGATIALAVVPETVSGTYKALMRPCGLTAPNLCEEVMEQAGDLGATMPLFGLALAMERARPGDKILLVGFGNGCDVLVLEMTGAVANGTTQEALRRGSILSSYSRFLSLTGNIDLDWGPRSEVSQKTSASVLARHSRDTHGFVGGRDARGNVQFPKTPIPVSPDANGPEPYEDVILRDVPAKVASITADRLNYTPDPPFLFGLVQFGNGARVAMELCDVEGSVPQVGDSLKMRFRVKAVDRHRHFRTYFWKAAPEIRPILNRENA
jgi:3-hydroxy-3-methylglutaryl CoA synthase